MAKTAAITEQQSFIITAIDGGADVVCFACGAAERIKVANHKAGSALSLEHLEMVCELAYDAGVQHQRAEHNKYGTK